MNKYQDFPAFLLSMIELAGIKYPNGFQDDTVMENVKVVIAEGWEYFVSITSVIDRSELTERDYSCLVNNTWLTRITLGLGAALSIGGSALLMNLQKHREILVAIKNVGLKYKNQFENHLGEQRFLDALIEEASEELARQIKNNR